MSGAEGEDEAEFHARMREEAARARARRGNGWAEAEAPWGGGGPWPPMLAEAALHGPAGEFVKRVLPHTEADPAALLLQMLVSAGNAAGPGLHYRVEADRHPARLWVLVVGRTSKAWKGVSKGRVRQV
jgi:hypothetical protein